MSDDNKYMCFNLGEEEFAIPLLQVKEVIAPPKITAVPFSPAYFEGMMNLRGQVLSIVDMRKKLSIKHNEGNQEKAVIVLDLGEVQLGAIVDSINKVVSIKPDEICERPASHADVKYVDGVYRSETDIILLIDIMLVLNGKDLQILNTQTKIAA